jgi:hypothetical protein
MILKNLSIRERTWLFLGVVLVVIAGIDRLVLTPVRNKGRRMDLQITVRKTELASYQHRAAQKAAYRNALDAYASYTRRVGSDEKETSRVLGTLEGLATDASVVLVDMKPRDPQDQAGFRRFAVEIEAESTPDQLIRFLRRVNATSDALRVDKLQVSAKERGSPFLRTSALISKLADSQPAVLALSQ